MGMYWINKQLMKAIVIIFCFLFSVANAQRSMLNGWANPTSPQATPGDQIFRTVSGGSGWEYLDPDTDTWTAMVLYDDPSLADGIGNITSDVGVTVRGKIFSNTGATNGGEALVISGDNVTVEYCLFRTGNDWALLTENNQGTTIRYCLFNDFSLFIYARNHSANLKITYTQFLNAEWDREAISCCRGQAIFLEDVTGSGNEIGYNRMENNTGEAFNEDQINTYQSGGNSGSRFLIHHNLIRGGEGSVSGGGIIAGDNGTVYVDIYNNDMVDPGWYGIQIYAGDNVRVTDNRVYSVPGMPWNSVGFLIYDGDGGAGNPCTNITMNTTNVGRYYRGNYYGNTYYPFENSGGCTGGTFSVTESTTLTPAGMSFPDHLINYVSEDDYWLLRSSKFRGSLVIASHEGDERVNAQLANVRRPTANAGTDQSIAISTATLNASGSSTLDGGAGAVTMTGYTWTQVSGPNTATMSASTSSTNNLSGLITGSYVFRLVVEQTNDQYDLKTYHADWITVAVGL